MFFDSKTEYFYSLVPFQYPDEPDNSEIGMRCIPYKASPIRETLLWQYLIFKQ